MLHLSPDDYRTMPWKNGGGTTTELVVDPPRSEREASALSAAFLYRVSIATVDSDGPFSSFPGCDRHIMLIAGAGMTLEVQGADSVELLPFTPFRFSGDVAVNATRKNGPVRDFNLMVDRARADATLACFALAAPRTIDCPAGATCLVHVLEGALFAAATGDTLITKAPLLVAPREAGARIVVGHVLPF